MNASIERAEQIVESDSQRYVLLQQFKNPRILRFMSKHWPRNLDDTDGAVDVLSRVSHRRHHHPEFRVT